MFLLRGVGLSSLLFDEVLTVDVSLLVVKEVVLEKLELSSFSLEVKEVSSTEVMFSLVLKGILIEVDTLSIGALQENNKHAKINKENFFINLL